MKIKYVILQDARTGYYYCGANHFTEELRNAKLYKNEKTALLNVCLKTIEDYDNLVIGYVEMNVCSDKEKRVAKEADFKNLSNYAYKDARRKAGLPRDIL